MDTGARFLLHATQPLTYNRPQKVRLLNRLKEGMMLIPGLRQGLVLAALLLFSSLLLAQNAVAAEPLPPEITKIETFREGDLVFFRLFYTDPDNDAEGFGFRGVNGSGWAEEQHPFSSPSYGRWSPGKIEYPFNHLCDTGPAYESDVEAWIYDSAGLRSASVTIHLTCGLSQATPYLGCYKDQGDPTGIEGRDLSGFFWYDPGMTNDRCVDVCRGRGFVYAGTQVSSQCFCGNSYGASGVANNCNMACAGNPNQICGGAWANSVYTTTETTTTEEGQFPSPGWYHNELGIIPGTSPILNEDDVSKISVSWEKSYVYRHPGEAPLYWYVELIFTNKGTNPQTGGCTGGSTDTITEHMQGTANSGSVISDDHICIRNPGFRVTLNPGESAVFWAIFHNVPWNGSDVAVEYIYVSPSGTGVASVVSPYVNPWYSPFDAPPPVICPPELVTLGTCEPREGP